MGIIVVGSLNYDLVTYTDRVPDAGETFPANSFETHTGGKGLNQTVAIAKLKDGQANYKVKMVGNVGDDSFGKQLVAYLNKNGVDTTDVKTHPDVSSGVATILVEEKNGQNRILITQGANGKTVYTSQQLEHIFSEENCAQDSMVVFQHEIPDPVAIMRWINENKPGFKVVYNPSPFHPLKKEDWLLCDILVVNEIESLQIIENVYDEPYISEIKAEIKKDFVGTYKKICEKLQKETLDQKRSAVVIITLGSEGVLFSSAAHPDVEYLPAIKVPKVLDTTGAGDTFLGGVVTQLYQKKSLKDAIKFSTYASSITIQHPGAAESIPHFPDVSAAVKKSG